MPVYLINENTPGAGVVEYDDAIAEVLLRESEDKGWHVADPVTGEPLEPIETPETPDGDQSADPTENGESADLPKE